MASVEKKNAGDVPNRDRLTDEKKPIERTGTAASKKKRKLRSEININERFGSRYR